MLANQVRLVDDSLHSAHSVPLVFQALEILLDPLRFLDHVILLDCLAPQACMHLLILTSISKKFSYLINVV